MGLTRMALRGIRKSAARRLIINGFFQSLLERLDSESLRAYLDRMVSDKLGIQV